MTLQFSLGSAAPETADTACVVVGVYEHGVLTSAAARVDSAADGGVIKRQVESGDISGKAGSTTVLFAPAGVTAKRVLVVGLGSQKSFDAARFQKVSIEAARALGRCRSTDAVSFLTEVDVPGRDIAWRVRTAVLATDHAAYRYTATFKPRDKSAQPELASVSFAGATTRRPAWIRPRDRRRRALRPRAGQPAAEHLQPGIHRRLRPRPLPTADASQLQRARSRRDGKARLRFAAGRGRGSVNKPKLIVLEYKGGNEGDKPYAFVGKGVTFDTGGISLKPGPGMEEMKFDMGGAAGVLGAFVAAVKMKLKLNLVCVVPAVENMPDGDSYRPSDVLTSLSGLTIEVLNTDAEGRLILCDALTYTAQTFQPHTIIDAATLTGACVIALGKHASGLMSKHDDLAAELLAAGEKRSTVHGACRCGTTTRRNSIPALPTSPTSAARAPARSPRAASCRASPKASAGRIWTSPAPHGTKAARAWPPAARCRCWRSG
jgi:leucyl aminopeptidase